MFTLTASIIALTTGSAAWVTAAMIALAVEGMLLAIAALLQMFPLEASA